MKSPKKARPGAPRAAEPAAAAAPIPVHRVAPGALGEDDVLVDDVFADPMRDAPREPPAMSTAPADPPIFRPLKVYAFDPSLGRTPGNVMTIPVRYEKLRPGPVGERVAVVDYDASRRCFYDPVDLDDPHIAIRGGLDPSESDPHFHQQMAYAVTCETLRRVESALGRSVRRRAANGAEPLRLYVYPHGVREANAYLRPDLGLMVFGYFQASDAATGRTAPGQMVFTCLSHAVIVHTAMHALIGAVRPDLMQFADMAEQDSVDLLSLCEGFADSMALLLHFSYREAVLETIQRTAGSIHRSVMSSAGDRAAVGAAIQAEVAVGNPLLVLGHQFGEATGRAEGLRSALGQAPDPTALQRLQEPHARGSILLAAIFDAFFTVYVQRSLDLFRIHRAGGGRIEGGDVPAPLAERLFGEAEAIAARVFGTCVRALDYCPVGSMTFGDFLRACITADCEYAPTDTWGLRDALMQAFRRRGIKAGASFFSEEALRWPIVDTAKLSMAGPRFVGLPEPDEAASTQNQAALRAFVEANAEALGLRPGFAFDVLPLEVSHIARADDTLHVALSTQVVPKSGAKSKSRPPGVALVFDGTGKLRYAIPGRAS